MIDLENFDKYTTTIISDNIKERREKMGISQSELGRKIHAPPATISKIEMGGRYPALKTMIKLSYAFGCKIDSLVNKRFE